MDDKLKQNILGAVNAVRQIAKPVHNFINEAPQAVGKAASETFIYNPKTKKVLPMSPLHDMQTIQTAQPGTPEYKEATTNLAGSMTMGGITKVANKPILQAGSGIIDGMNDLMAQARKYKSADEFFLYSKKGRELLREKGIKSQEAIENWFNQNVAPKEATLDNLNPTGSLYVEYDPKSRMTMKMGKNITTYDKTAGLKPDDMVTVYRGASKNHTKINPGDFITTKYELAKAYTGVGNIIEMKVRAKDILDDITEPLGDEYIYRPQK